MAEILRALKLSGQCISTDAAYNLDIWFDVSPVRPRNYMVATMLRACHKTFEGFSAMHEELERKALASLALNASRSILPWGWDASAFCSNLFMFANGELPPPFTNLQPQILSIVRDKSRKVPLQKAIHSLLIANSKCDWPSEIRHKVYLLAPDSPCATPFTDDHFGALLESLNVCKRSVKTSYFKSLTNSWSTRSRYQEDSHCCIFGCDESKDNLKHYFHCDSMWTLATAAIPLPIAFLNGTLEDRLSLHSASVVRIRILAACFRAYHALVFEHKQLIEVARLTDNYEELHLLFMQCVRAAWLHE